MDITLMSHMPQRITLQPCCGNKLDQFRNFELCINHLHTKIYKCRTLSYRYWNSPLTIKQHRHCDRASLTLALLCPSKLLAKLQTGLLSKIFVFG